MDEQQTTANTANTVNTAPAAEPFTANDPPKTEFSTKEKVLAWLAALVGYLFCRTFFVWNKPFMGLIFTVLLFAFAFVFFGKQRRKARCYFYPVSALLLSAGLFLNGSPLLRFCVFTYAVVAFFLFCQTGSDTALEDCAGQLYVLETVKALLVSPFKSIGAAVRSIGSNKGGKKIGKTLLLILAGIGLTIIPTALVLSLLSYDANFTTILENIRVNIFKHIFSRLWSLIFGIPLGMFVYGALYSGAHPVPDTYTRESCINLENKMKFMPALVGAVALIPLLFLYIVFIIAHADYYHAVFSGALPKAYTYAEFARDGFFRLCVAAAVNAVVLILLRVFTRKTSTDRISPVVKICTAVLSLVTIVISATAISQMLMYVSAYGLTRLRLYTLWFMALIILLFFLTILKQFVTKLPFAAAALAIFVLFFALLAVPDTDALIAEHNYDCYVSGRTEEIDVYYLEQLGPSAIPTLCQLATDERADNMVRSHAATLLEQYARDNKDRSVWELSLPELRAERAYKEYKDNESK